MATTAEHIAAGSDPQLLARFIAKAEQEGVPMARDWVQANYGTLVSIPIADEQNIADVYTYAANNRKALVDALPPEPGSDLAAVTDIHLATAISTVRNLPTA